MFVCFGFPEQADTDTCGFFACISMEGSRQEFLHRFIQKMVRTKYELKVVCKAEAA